MLMGSTMPEVPRMEMPPTMPRAGLKVFEAMASPSGTEITTRKPQGSPAARRTSSSAWVIICRGTWLMAAAPTG